ncbi:MAG: hypothetical protein HDR17_06850 [Lachnospiraceae bacterium]|nr:hypothetical protein [Lachnospiraceae bacterium]
MKSVTAAYGRCQNFIERIVFPFILVIYPLLRIRLGIDMADTTYSLSNFQYFPSMDGTWMVATFLANVVGNLFMHLPFGDKLMGMYFYTSLIQSMTALAVYAAFRRSDRSAGRIPMPLVFAGEIIALGLCWCPSTILYNYLTYLLMTVGILLLYRGILKEDRRYYVAAGVCLGANVAVRMPNVMQAALIVAVWYGTAVCGRKWQQAVRDTLWCIAGYVVGFGVPLAAICIKYGAGAYPAMIQTMFAMTEKATDYKPSAMLTGMFSDYITGLFWMVFAGICMAGGWMLFMLQRRLFPGKKGVAGLCGFVYAAVLLVLLRFYWGRGVFNFLYYDFGSIYYPAVLFLLTAVYAAVYCLCRKSVGAEQKILAVLVLVQILITPLGGNNKLYPIINNLFIVVPFVLWVGYGKLKAVVGMPHILLVVFLLIQSVGFHLSFSFQDGRNGEARDTILTVPDKVAGIYTNQDNAACLEELAEYTQQEQLTGREVILYGEVPGLGYFLDMPSALSTFWPDLDSYRMVEYERDMEQLGTPPVVIVSSSIAAYLNEDADGMNWFGVEKEKLDQDEKLQILGEYMKVHSYQEGFSNARYVVYVTES